MHHTYIHTYRASSAKTVCLGVVNKPKIMNSDVRDTSLYLQSLYINYMPEECNKFTMIQLHNAVVYVIHIVSGFSSVARGWRSWRPPGVRRRLPVSHPRRVSHKIVPNIAQIYCSAISIRPTAVFKSSIQPMPL